MSLLPETVTPISSLARESVCNCTLTNQSGIGPLIHYIIIIVVIIINIIIIMIIIDEQIFFGGNVIK